VDVRIRAAGGTADSATGGHSLAALDDNDPASSFAVWLLKTATGRDYGDSVLRDYIDGRDPAAPTQPCPRVFDWF
jgi:hypothetical protein